MTTKTRYFVIASLLVLTIGIGTGLVAYYVGLPTSAFSSRGGPAELQYVPRNAAVVAFANVQEVMSSELRQRLRQAMPVQGNGQREFQNETGINIENDIDRVVACLDTERTSGNIPGSGMVLARGRFDEVKIEALMREHGAQVQDYKGKRLIVADITTLHKDAAGQQAPGDAPVQKPARTGDFALAFIEPGLAAVGSADLVRTAIDLKDGGESVATNEDLMNLVRSLEGSNNAWAVGRFDALTARAKLPAGVAGRLPAITWFSVGTHVNGGISGLLRADTRDGEAANNLRDVVRGFLALAKMQSGARPELRAVVDSIEVSGTGNTVALSFSVPAQVFDLIGALAGRSGDKAH